MKAIGIIPARFAATRLPGKPLVDLNGKSMIRRVWEGASESTLLERVVVATDDKRIVAECRSFGAEAVLTDPALPSGTDRIAAACKALGNYDAVVNIQGDEPLLRGALVDALMQALANGQADVTTPVTPITSPDDLDNPAVVKVAMNAGGRALYFSRSAIPFVRDAAQKNDWLSLYPYRKHIGLYAYRRAAIERFVSLPPSQLERTESLEQLRLLEDGAVFLCVETDAHLVAVDTPADAERVRSILDQE